MSLTALRRRRGTVQSSITRIVTKITGLEKKPDPASLSVVDNMQQQLASYDIEFRKCHYNVLDVIDESDDATHAQEQKAMNTMKKWNR